MSVSIFVPAPPPVVPPVPVRRFTVDEYHQIIQAGILGEDDDVELLEGWIVPEMPRNPAHDALVEIADSSLGRDRSIKARVYAAAGVPLYWIIDLVDDQIEVYTQPTGPDPAPDYRMRQDFKRSDFVPLIVDGIELGPIPGSDLLP